ncbi:ATPase [Massilia arenosa]|uniref:ATPase n=1 Tax=Zemynaea arenosa TaxID=2561931 RepID=A0A4Y9SQT3_9BURK|nr:BadF/BadG/BcrA/BcrD ATPase family protein [Massilia arenosa]TFW26993.1 ATPase [Massilia arenosa]
MLSPDPAPGLGIDAGGTQTRWALARPDGTIMAEGEAPGLSALQMRSTDGRAIVRATLQRIAQDVLAHARPGRVHAGMTGFGGEGDELARWIAEPLGLAPADVAMSSDMVIAYLDSFAPGEGYLVYAGTGSIGAYIDAQGEFHRAGGRGVMLDDGGGGFWIAREALRYVWRTEDERPGAWQDSALTRAVFDHIGGSDWALSRHFIYGQERGEIGKLALVVAAVANEDRIARDILRAAGAELARLARALVTRFGPRPVVLSGRAAQLHPLIFESVRESLAPEIELRIATAQPHHAAARLASSAGAARPLPPSL